MNPRHLLLAACLALAGPAAAAPFQLGVAPHTSPRVLLEMYQPLRRHLERALGQPVEVVTAPNFTSFAERGLQQEYDLTITTGHQARLFSVDAGYLPLLTYSADFRAVVVVAARGPVRSAADLRGQAVLGLSPSSLVTLWGLHWLASQGVRDLEVRHVSASDSVAQQVADGQAAAGLTSLANTQRLPAELRGQLRMLVESPPMAGRVYLLNARQAGRRREVEAALRAFAGTAEGRAYLEAHRLEGYRSLRAGELEALAPYAEQVRQELRRGARP